MEKLLLKLLETHHYPHIKTDDLRLHMRSDADFPSLKAISSTLDHFNVGHVVAEIPKSSFDQLPDSFLVIFEKDNISYVGHVAKKTNGIKVMLDTAKPQALAMEEFMAQWNGTVLVMENADSDHRLVASGVQGTIVIMLIILCTALVYASDGFVAACYTLLGLAGMGLSWLIALQKLGTDNDAVRKVCQSMGASNGCQDLIVEEDDKILGGVGFTTACAVFFLSQTVVTLLLGFNAPYAYAVAICTVPAVVYSLWLQISRSKWCALCLGVTTVLLVQLALAYIGVPSSSWAWDAPYMGRSLAIVVAIALAWHTGWPVISQYFDQRQLGEKFMKLKRTDGLFEHLLHAGGQKVGQPSLAPALWFGDEGASSIVLGITNPTCGYCREPYQVYRQMLIRLTSGVRLGTIFNVPYATADNPATKIASSIIGRYHANKPEALTMLDEWYQKRDIDA